MSKKDVVQIRCDTADAEQSSRVRPALSGGLDGCSSGSSPSRALSSMPGSSRAPSGSGATRIIVRHRAGERADPSKPEGTDTLPSDRTRCRGDDGESFLRQLPGRPRAA
jgi:hypothetical protein